MNSSVSWFTTSFCISSDLSPSFVETFKFVTDELTVSLVSLTFLIETFSFDISNNCIECRRFGDIFVSIQEYLLVSSSDTDKDFEVCGVLEVAFFVSCISIFVVRFSLLERLSCFFIELFESSSFKSISMDMSFILESLFIDSSISADISLLSSAFLSLSDIFLLSADTFFSTSSTLLELFEERFSEELMYGS